jgi:salicylate hydroxylase
LRIHRADLQRCLIQHLSIQGSGKSSNKTPCTLHLSHRLTDYIDNSSSLPTPHTGPIILHFANQPSRTCDILVGADGIKSTVRRLFLQRLNNQDKFGVFMDPVWSGAVAYRGLIAREDLEEVFPSHRVIDRPGVMVRSYLLSFRHAPDNVRDLVYRQKQSKEGLPKARFI